MTRDIVLTEHNSTVATPATAGSSTPRKRRRRSAVGPIKTVSILGLVGAFVAAIALPAFAGTAAPAAPVVAAVEAGPEEQPQELVVASTVDDKELDRNALSATSATEIAEAKAAAEAEAQRLADLAALAAQGSLTDGAPMLASASGSYDAGAVSLPVGSGSVIWPTGSSATTSPYGWRNGRMHEGTDFAASYAPLYAMSDGVVVWSSYDGCWGNTVRIEHSIGGERVQSLYAHMSTFGVGVGETVTAGQYVGTSGNTGCSEGPHLHFELRVNGSLVDPYGFLYNYAG